MSSGLEKNVLLIGFSGVGKSSFVNEISEQELAEVGSRGQSSTMEIKRYPVGKAAKLFNDDTSDLYITDVIGYNDSDCARDNNFISNLIKASIVEQKSSEIDAILIFESTISDSQSYRILLNDMMNIFGEKVKNSVIIIHTKWDKLDQSDHTAKSEVFDEMSKEFKCAKFINKTNKNKVFHGLSEQIYKNQLNDLKKLIQTITPYKIFENMKELDEERQRILVEIKESDPERYTYQSVFYEEDQLIETDHVVTYEDIEKRNKTEEEIQARAIELQKAKGMRQVTKIRNEPRNVSYTYQEVENYSEPRTVRDYYLFGLIRESRTVWVDQQRIVNKTGYRTEYHPVSYTESEPYPLETFIDEARNETVKVIKEKVIKEMKTVKVQKESKTKVEAHSDDYYMLKAQEKLANYYREKCRANQL